MSHPVCRHSGYRAGSQCLLAAALAAALGGCMGANPSPEASPPQNQLPADPAHLRDQGVQARLQTALQLTEQHRFTDARAVLKELRAAQPAASEGRRALTAAMARLSLLAGELARFRELMGALEGSGSAPYRVDPGRAAEVTLYRALTGARQPVNAPAQLLETLKRLPALQSETAGGANHD